MDPAYDYAFKEINFQNYLGFSSPGINLKFNKANIIIGPNNFGKSVLIRGLRKVAFLELSKPNSGKYGSSMIFDHVEIDRNDFHSDETSYSLRYTVQTDQEYKPLQAGFRPLKKSANDQYDFEFTFNKSAGNHNLVFHNPPNVDVPHSEAGIVNLLKHIGPKLIYIPNERKIEKFINEDEIPLEEKYTFGGAHVLPLLLEWNSPAPKDATEARGKLTKFIKLFSTITGLEEVSLTPVARERTLYLSYKCLSGKRIDSPISNMGFGLSQIIVILCAILKFGKNKTYLIEEPEIGLHPTTQRKLIRTLLDETEQFICTTHSNHFLDLRDNRVSYFQADYSIKASRYSINLVQPETLSYELLSQLGVKPSSLFEANCVIWVEGPSDHIYIKFWLDKLYEENLASRKKIVENLDYCFLYYGGSVMSHLSTDILKTVDLTSGVNISDALIYAFKVNPYFFIYADSDRETKGGPFKHPYLGKAVASLSPEQISKSFWPSEPKEIECYLSEEFLIDQVEVAKRDKSFSLDENDFYNSILVINNKIRLKKYKVKNSPNKVNMALDYAARYKNERLEKCLNDYMKSDLLTNVAKLYDFIEDTII